MPGSLALGLGLGDGPACGASAGGRGAGRGRRPTTPGTVCRGIARRRTVSVAHPVVVLCDNVRQARGDHVWLNLSLIQDQDVTGKRAGGDCIDAVVRRQACFEILFERRRAIQPVDLIARSTLDSRVNSVNHCIPTSCWLCRRGRLLLWALRL